jgi:hypothetical protein
MGMAREDVDAFATLEIPDSERGVKAPRDDTVAIWANFTESN